MTWHLPCTLQCKMAVPHPALPQKVVFDRLRRDGVGRLNGRRPARRTDNGAERRALNCSALILSTSASAALPEAARGGLHGGGLCELCSLTFCSICLGGDWVRHKSHPGRTRACWGSPESSLQRENVCYLVESKSLRCAFHFSKSAG